MNHESTKRRSALWLAVLATLLWAAPLVWAQTATATVRGLVVDEKGAPAAGATVEALNKDTGFTYSDVTGADGGFRIAGLAPGVYDVKVSLPTYNPLAKTLQLLVGQVASIQFKLSPEELKVENVTVIGRRVVEVRTPEIATNVTPEQMEALPQNERNFLNFAALAPGVRVSNTSDGNLEFRANGQSARQGNVFIDGVSFKNDVLQGGVVGQDSSRGNPFPQNAVQEFRVLTSNFKAEYDKAASAIITAVTKTGGNEWSGDLFAQYQPNGLVSQDRFSADRGEPKQDYKRWQGGVSAGGPLIKDKLHLFVSYEQNDQDREYPVFLAANANVPTWLRPQLEQYDGNFNSPFRAKLFFGKLSYQPAANQTLDFTVNVRRDRETRGFGTTTAYEAAEDFRVDVTTLNLSHRWLLGKWVNEAQANFQRYEWNPTELNPDTIGKVYEGDFYFRVGGKDSQQDFKQDRFVLRDDLSHLFTWHGEHAVKVGATAGFARYDIMKELFNNPLFHYQSWKPLAAGEERYAIPYQAQYGYGNPDLSESNNEYGVFVQDDWRPVQQLEINLGLRWDYETDMLNNNYVTPAGVRQNLINAGINLPDAYFTDGGQRPAYKGMIQPRLGFSWDVAGDGKTVVFGGYGRYFDRQLYNDLLDEKYRLNYQTLTFNFTTTGEAGRIPWQDSYLSKAGLQTLIAQGYGKPELYLVDNNTKPPQSDQWSLGVRRTFGQWIGALSVSKVDSKNLLTYFCATRVLGISGCAGTADYSNVFISSDAKQTKYKAAYMTWEKPYTAKDKWGFSAAYTLSKSEKNGGDLFSAFDYASPDSLYFYPGDDDERHRLVMSGIVGLPYGFKVSTLITLGSGTPHTIYDASQGWDHFRNAWNEGRPQKHSFLLPGDWWAYRSMDMRLQKDFELGKGQRIGLMVEGVNIFNFRNDSCFGWDQSLIQPGGVTGPDFGKGTCQLNPRRVQVGMNYHF